MPIPMSKSGFIKPYNIVHDGDDGATIDLYGEVVSHRPTDWWTGKTVEGNFIVLDEFLQDLEQLKGKESVTVHINSVGGEFYAGLAIYNRLRSLNASVTTINDSLAASAGSIIFMAGDKGKRKVHAGSNLMVHGVLGFMCGYYNTNDLKDVIKSLDAHNKAAVAAYCEATGLDEETVKKAMSKDTYMTGQEAVDAGWADEVITAEGTEPVNMKLTPDKSRLMVNGHAVAACLFGKLPEGIPEMTAEEFAALSTPDGGAEPPTASVHPAQQVDNNTHQNGGMKNMEVKNVEELRKAYPEFCAEIANTARAEGVTAERNRIKGIEDMQNAVPDAEMVKNAKYGENAMSVEQFAVAAMQKMAATNANALNNLNSDATASGAAQVAGSAAPGNDPKQLTDDEQAVALLVGAIPANKKKEEN